MAGERILVTGGASFIGSHLVDALLRNEAIVTVADDFSSGKLASLEYPLKKVSSNSWVVGDLTVQQGDLKDKCFARSVMKNIDVVFHLAYK